MQRTEEKFFEEKKSIIYVINIFNDFGFTKTL
jgi:hypothetical protein